MCDKEDSLIANVPYVGHLFTSHNDIRTQLFLLLGFFSKRLHLHLNCCSKSFLVACGQTPRDNKHDQDLVIKLAIANKMSDTFHRLCKWHITYKMSDKVGRVYQDHEAMRKFYDILNNSEDVVDFGDLWQRWVIEKYLVENLWLREMYSICSHWCLVYLVDHFIVGMSTTQRSKSMNNIVKVKVKSYFTLLESIKKFKGAVSSMLEKENVKYHDGYYMLQKALTSLEPNV